MNDNSPFNAAARAALVSDPELILADHDVMTALSDATSPSAGQADVVDFRAMAMRRLEQRMTKMEEAQSEIIAASWQRVNATEQTHRAMLQALEAQNLNDLVGLLDSAVASTLGLASILTVSEADVLPKAENARIMENGQLRAYCGRAGRDVMQRAVEHWPDAFESPIANDIRSEAVLRLDHLAELPGPVALVLGSRSKATYGPEMGGDLLRFFGTFMARLFALMLRTS